MSNSPGGGCGMGRRADGRWQMADGRDSEIAQSPETEWRMGEMGPMGRNRTDDDGRDARLS